MIKQIISQTVLIGKRRLPVWRLVKSCPQHPSLIAVITATADWDTRICGR
jgi:hypothetical protein